MTQYDTERYVTTPYDMMLYDNIEVRGNTTQLKKKDLIQNNTNGYYTKQKVMTQYNTIYNIAICYDTMPSKNHTIQADVIGYTDEAI